VQDTESTNRRADVVGEEARIRLTEGNSGSGGQKGSEVLWKERLRENLEDDR